MDYYKGKRKNQIDFFNEFNNNNTEEMIQWIVDNKPSTWKNLSMDSKEYLLYDKFCSRFISELKDKSRGERRVLFVNVANLVN